MLIKNKDCSVTMSWRSQSRISMLNSVIVLANVSMLQEIEIPKLPGFGNFSVKISLITPTSIKKPVCNGNIYAKLLAQ
ncbi:hypothetical protein DERP_014007 [Dermatophagoides pteronyssinus]|uniref:Uncharacterized protein n=1 Tax=Dermatophagoides pteronyssinus TaxID=6956 RepID=A0ABQ8JCV8_DERPT|nr:hypothetical protein DERP_014007 [Dermatophagoides pteronyssinus]